MEPLELYIYDEIGPEYYGLIGAKTVLAAIEEAGSRHLVVRINSPGGDVFQAQAIYNALLRHAPGVTVEIDALAASAASYVAMAGRPLRIAENGLLMIHRAWTIAAGNAEDLTQVAGTLGKIDGVLAETYAARSGKPVDEVKNLLLLAAETWFNAQEALDAGMVDEIGQRLNVAARLRDGMLDRMPERYRAVLRQDKATPAKRQASIYRPDLVARTIDILRKRVL